MDQGWVKLYRQLMLSKVFAIPTALKIWIWCLIKASHIGRYVALKVGKGETVVKLLPGQFIYGRSKAEEELLIDGCTIDNWIAKFESEEYDQMVSREPSSQYSIITVCNWETYQGGFLEDEQPINNQSTTNEQPYSSQLAVIEQPTSTYNNVKNLKKVKNVEKSISDCFEAFREKYPGTRRGLATELNGFLKKNSLEDIPLLLSALEKEIAHRKYLAKTNQFVPPWKNLSTWINKRCWEQEFTDGLSENSVPEPKPVTNYETELDSLTKQRLRGVQKTNQP
ncbi:MAG TPA: hypothetical protein VFG54_01895 [Prolixibacteraceae bacterium]|nr:hypothetical protein [Prolixibacteraceae bacterium]